MLRAVWAAALEEAEETAMAALAAMDDEWSTKMGELVSRMRAEAQPHVRVVSVGESAGLVCDALGRNCKERAG